MRLSIFSDEVADRSIRGKHLLQSSSAKVILLNGLAEAFFCVL
jgi:hypothetical protein